MLDLIIEFNDYTKIKSPGWPDMPMMSLLLEVHKTFPDVKSIAIARFLPI